MMERLKDDLNNEKSQRHAALCMGIVCLCLGIPIWWKTTEVYRAELPYSDIQELAENPFLSTKIDVDLVANTKSNLKLIEDAFVKSGKSDDFKYIHTECSYRGSVLPLAEIEKLYVAAKNDVVHDESEGSGDLTIYFHLTDEVPHPKVFLSHGRSIFVLMSEAWFAEEIQDIVTSVSQLIRESIINEMSLEDVSTRAYGIKRDFSENRDAHMMKTVQPNKGYDIVFSLICPEPDKIQASWDIEEAVESYVKPMISKLEGFAEFNLGSQILYNSKLGVKPKMEKLDDGTKYYYLTQQQLSYVVNPIESRLGTQISPNPTLNFVIYVTEKRFTPQYIMKSDGHLSTTNTFLVPRWGAIKLQNFEKNENDTQLPRFVKIDSQEMMSVFLAQLRSLLGIEGFSKFDNFEIELASTGPSSLRDWELDYLLRAKTVENIALSIHTLDSLAQLLGKIHNIVINDNIAKEVFVAVEAIKSARQHLEAGDLKNALKHSNMAFVSSEIAFFDPTLLELLYFPEDQKFAIYIPLFLPIALPLIGSFVSALKWLRKSKEKSE